MCISHEAYKKTGNNVNRAVVKMFFTLKKIINLHSTPYTVCKFTRDHKTHGLLCFGVHETTNTQTQYMQTPHSDMIQDPCINLKYT